MSVSGGDAASVAAATQAGSSIVDLRAGGAVVEAAAAASPAGPEIGDKPSYFLPRRDDETEEAFLGRVLRPVDDKGNPVRIPTATSLTIDQTLSMYVEPNYARAIPQDATGVKGIVPNQPKSFQDLLLVGAVNVTGAALAMDSDDILKCIKESLRDTQTTLSQRHIIHWLMVAVQAIKMTIQLIPGLVIVTYDDWRSFVDKHGSINLAYTAVQKDWTSDETKNTVFRKNMESTQASLITDLSFFLIEASFQPEWSWLQPLLFSLDKSYILEIYAKTGNSLTLFSFVVRSVYNCIQAKTGGRKNSLPGGFTMVGEALTEVSTEELINKRKLTQPWELNIDSTLSANTMKKVEEGLGHVMIKRMVKGDDLMLKSGGVPDVVNLADMASASQYMKYVTEHKPKNPRGKAAAASKGAGAGAGDVQGAGTGAGDGQGASATGAKAAAAAAEASVGSKRKKPSPYAGLPPEEMANKIARTANPGQVLRRMTGLDGLGNISSDSENERMGEGELEEEEQSQSADQMDALQDAEEIAAAHRRKQKEKQEREDRRNEREEAAARIKKAKQQKEQEERERAAEAARAAGGDAAEAAGAAPRPPSPRPPSPPPRPRKPRGAAAAAAAAPPFMDLPAPLPKANSLLSFVLHKAAPARIISKQAWFKKAGSATRWSIGLRFPASFAPSDPPHITYVQDLTSNVQAGGIHSIKTSHRTVIANYMKYHPHLIHTPNHSFPVIYGVEMMEKKEYFVSVLAYEYIYGFPLCVILNPGHVINKYANNYRDDVLHSPTEEEEENEPIKIGIRLDARFPLLILFARALREFHSLGLVHRSISSDHFMVAHQVLLDLMVTYELIPCFNIKKKVVSQDPPAAESDSEFESPIEQEWISQHPEDSVVVVVEEDEEDKEDEEEASAEEEEEDASASDVEQQEASKKKKKKEKKKAAAAGEEEEQASKKKKKKEKKKAAAAAAAEEKDDAAAASPPPAEDSVSANQYSFSFGKVPPDAKIDQGITSVDLTGTSGLDEEEHKEMMDPFERLAIKRVGRVALVGFQHACFSDTVDGAPKPPMEPPLDLANPNYWFAVNSSRTVADRAAFTDADKAAFKVLLFRRPAARVALRASRERRGLADIVAEAEISDADLVDLLTPSPLLYTSVTYDGMGLFHTIREAITVDSTFPNEATVVDRKDDRKNDAIKHFKEWRNWNLLREPPAPVAVAVAAPDGEATDMELEGEEKEEKKAAVAAPAEAAPAAAAPAARWIPNVADFFASAVFETEGAPASAAYPYYTPAYTASFAQGIVDFKDALKRWPELIPLLRRLSRQHVSVTLEAEDSENWPPLPRMEEVCNILKDMDVSLRERWNQRILDQCNVHNLNEMKLRQDGDAALHTFRINLKALSDEDLQLLRDESDLAKAFIVASLYDPDGPNGQVADEPDWKTRVGKQRSAIMKILKDENIRTYLETKFDPVPRFDWVQKAGQWNIKEGFYIFRVIAMELQFKLRFLIDSGESDSATENIEYISGEPGDRPWFNFISRHDTRHWNATWPKDRPALMPVKKKSADEQEGGAQKETGLGLESEEQQKSLEKAAAEKRGGKRGGKRQQSGGAAQKSGGGAAAEAAVAEAVVAEAVVAEAAPVDLPTAIQEIRDKHEPEWAKKAGDLVAVPKISAQKWHDAMHQLFGFPEKNHSRAVFSGVVSRYSEQSESGRRIKAEMLPGVDRSKFKFDRSPYVDEYCLIPGKKRPSATAMVLAGQHDHVHFERMVHASASAGESIGKEFHQSLMRRKKTSLRMSVPARCVLVLISPIYLEDDYVLAFGRSEDWNKFRQKTLASKNTFADKELLLSVLPDPSIRVSPAVCGTDPIRSYLNPAHARVASPNKEQLHSRPLVEAWKENLNFSVEGWKEWTAEGKETPALMCIMHERDLLPMECWSKEKESFVDPTTQNPDPWPVTPHELLSMHLIDQAARDQFEIGNIKKEYDRVTAKFKPVAQGEPQPTAIMQFDTKYVDVGAFKAAAAAAASKGGAAAAGSAEVDDTIYAALQRFATEEAAKKAKAKGAEASKGGAAQASVGGGNLVDGVLVAEGQEIVQQSKGGEAKPAEATTGTGRRASDGTATATAAAAAATTGRARTRSDETRQTQLISTDTAATATATTDRRGGRASSRRRRGN